MPAIYKKEFNELYETKKKEGYIFITEEDEIIDGKSYKYLAFNVDMSILRCAMNLAKVKSRFTMKQNQAGIPRSDIMKLQKCCQGILAEMFVHILLMERYGFKVFRYDLERETFFYKTEEYDIKIKIDNSYYEVESRSSNVHHKSIEKFIKEDIIIGPYINKIKMQDELVDFHFRPIYMPDFNPFYYRDGRYYYSDKLITGEVKLVITGVATREEFIKFGYEKSLGQKGTTYQVVDAIQIGDVKDMDDKFKNLAEEKAV